MEMNIRMPPEPALVLLVGVEIVEDDMQLAIWKGATTRFIKPSNSMRRRRLQCDAKTFPVATLSAAKSVVVPCRL
jgi:hypothetical protein